MKHLAKQPGVMWQMPPTSQISGRTQPASSFSPPRTSHSLMQIDGDDEDISPSERFGRGVSAKAPFEVKLQAAQLQSSQVDYLEALRKTLDLRSPLPSSDVDHRHISPWHITTRWHSYLDGWDISEALALIVPPKEDDPLFYLIACIKFYMQATYDSILYTSEVCRQILNTDTLTDLKGPKDVTGIFAKMVYNMHRASSIVVSTQNEPNMKWKDGSNWSTLIYLGHEVSLDALRRCQGAIEDATRALLQDTLLFGHFFPIDIAALKDDMGNSQPGYSLFTDRVNAQVLVLVIASWTIFSALLLFVLASSLAYVMGRSCGMLLPSLPG
ncbi:hypothetical protein BD413DRAFT_496258 [Trametes elegans]|nr:hypothetical protein BD413DRAFT_496258 [Trametes elegans]